MIKRLRALFNPDRYHGWGKEKKYFEGWYYKVISQDEAHAYAFIPGIAMDENGMKQAFIQVLDGKKFTAEYHKFSVENFHPKSGRFKVNIEDNEFTNHLLQLNLPLVKGKLNFYNTVPWPNNWYSPGIMGPYSFVPFMECYHGIVSMDHEITGKLSITGKEIDFNGGRGYIEKDWGRSFPSAYIWMQSNHFSKPGISFKASVAKIPWLRSSFVGFIAGLWLGNKLYQFTTYNSTVLKRSFVDEKRVEISMENKQYRLDINAERNESTELASPILGFMDGRIKESMTSKVEVLLTDKKNKNVSFHDKGRNTGLEVAGKIDEIIIT